LINALTQLVPQALQQGMEVAGKLAKAGLDLATGDIAGSIGKCMQAVTGVADSMPGTGTGGGQSSNQVTGQEGMLAMLTDMGPPPK